MHGALGDRVTHDQPTPSIVKYRPWGWVFNESLVKAVTD